MERGEKKRRGTEKGEMKMGTGNGGQGTGQKNRQLKTKGTWGKAGEQKGKRCEKRRVGKREKGCGVGGVII